MQETEKNTVGLPHKGLLVTTCDSTTASLADLLREVCVGKRVLVAGDREECRGVEDERFDASREKYWLVCG